MASRPEALRAVAACGLSALALFFGTGLHPSWGVLFVAPVPVLIVAYEGGPARAASLGFLAWFSGGFNLWAFYRQTLGVPLPVVLVLMAMPAVAFALALLLSRALLRRGAEVLGLLAVPALWVSFEYVLSLTSPHGTYGNLAYSQVDLLPLVQLASVTGLWGISFVVLLVPACLAVAFHLRSSPRLAFRLVAAAAALLAVVHAWGVSRLRRPSAGERVAVALLAADPASGSPPLPSEDEGLRRVEAYASRIASWRHDGVRILVLPEKIARLDGARLTRAAETLGAAAASARVTLIAGLQQTDPEQGRILALAFGPDGRPLGTYAKHHLLPPFESDSRPGTDILVLAGEPRWGVQICKDMDFPALSRRYAAAGVGLMAVPAWDFVKDGRLHSRMAVMRGIESGLTIVRAARDGLMTVSDERGRILAEARSGPGFDIVTASVAAHPAGSTYSRWGDWFAWVGLLILAVCLARAAGVASITAEAGA